MAVNNPPLPLVIPRKRTTLVGQVEAFSLKFDITKQTTADIQHWIRGIYAGEVEKQKRLGNPPTITTVDNNTGKSPMSAEKKIVAIFGVVLPMSAMAIVERELRSAIRRATSTLTGDLSNVSGNWQWLHLTQDGRTELVTGGRLASFGPGDALILRPTPGRINSRGGKNYVWMMNTYAKSGFTGRQVESKGTLTTASGLSTANPRKPRMGRKPKKAPQNVGFMLAAVQNIRRKAEFRQFNIKVSFGRWDGTAGNRLGLTPSILIRPKVTRAR